MADGGSVPAVQAPSIASAAVGARGGAAADGGGGGGGMGGSAAAAHAAAPSRAANSTRETSALHAAMTLGVPSAAVVLRVQAAAQQAPEQSEVQDLRGCRSDSPTTISKEN